MRIGMLGLTLITMTTALSAQHAGHPAPSDTSRQQPMQRMTSQDRVLGIPMSRDGSGTAWLPDSSPMHAFHRTVGSWELMLHGNGFAQYIREGGSRGEKQFGSVNWMMGMLSGKLAGGTLTLRSMLSAEPLTVGECGYPDLLATGEGCNGQRLHDRQHPHDLFMELAASYDRALSNGLAMQLYGGPAGEPALGPVAYPHRISAMPNPMAPISHHWLDATHISFGVVSAGLFGRKWKLEGSLFNGREPDEDRYDLDLARLDSYSGRLWVLPGPHWALQASAGRLREAEPGRNGGPPRDQTRLSASATYQATRSNGGNWATTVAWGQNREADHRSNAVLGESSFSPDSRNVFFLRLELAEKTGEDLVLEEHAPELAENIFTLGTGNLGYLRRMSIPGGLLVGLGARVGISVVPSALEPFYGSRTPVGFALFLNVIPGAMKMGEMSGM